MNLDVVHGCSFAVLSPQNTIQCFHEGLQALIAICRRLKATPEYQKWAAGRRRQRIRTALTSASTLRAVTMLVVAGAAFWAGQFAPSGTLPELLQPSQAPVEPQLPGGPAQLGTHLP